MRLSSANSLRVRPGFSIAAVTVGVDSALASSGISLQTHMQIHPSRPSPRAGDNVISVFPELSGDPIRRTPDFTISANAGISPILRDSRISGDQSVRKKMRIGLNNSSMCGEFPHFAFLNVPSNMVIYEHDATNTTHGGK